MSLEPFTTAIASRYLRRIADPEPAQRALLKRILASSAGSPTASALGLRGDESFEDFLGLEPKGYAFYEPLVQRVRDGDHLAFGRDPVIALGETSGTTSVPKLVPYNAHCPELLARFARLIGLFRLTRQRTYWPRPTKWLLITAPSCVRQEGKLPIGFVSGLMYRTLSSARRRGVLPSADVAAITDWDERVRCAAIEAISEPVGALFSVPAYLDRFLCVAAERAGGRPLTEVWPDLDEAYYSGTDAGHYPTKAEACVGRPIRWRGLYMATEGIFGADLDRDAGHGLRLLPDYTIMTFDDGAALKPMWQLERGRRYEVVITTVAGLIQYRIGDLIEVVDTEPLRVRVVGRAGEEINLATEKLSCRQAKDVVAEVGRKLALRTDRFVVMPDPANPRRHLWLIESDDPEVTSDLSIPVDRALASANPSYAKLRERDTILLMPRVVAVPRGTFDAYERAGFQRGGQFKFRHLFQTSEDLLCTAGMEALARYMKVQAEPTHA